MTNHSSCIILTDTQSVDGKKETALQIMAAWRAWKKDRSHLPIFLAPPTADSAKIADEIAKLGIPRNADVLLRTSGSTAGQGKIVALSWESLEASAQATQEYFGAAGTWINTLPLSHIAGFQTIFRSFFAGFAPIIGDFRTFSDFRAAIATSSAPHHYLSQVPTQLSRLLDSLPSSASSSAQNEIVAESGISRVLVGGAAINTTLLQRAAQHNLRVVTSYGMTETCGGCVYDGLPIGDVRISIGKNGQISLYSQMVAQGYLGTADNTAFSVGDNAFRWHHTRDWGAIKDGKLCVYGRIDDAINTGGLTVIPQLLEDAIATQFQTECVVVGIPNAIWGEEIVAVTKKKLAVAQVKSFLKESFEPGWVPHKFYPLASLLESSQNDANIANEKQNFGDFPLTASGKINRRLIAQLVAKDAKN